MKFINDLFKSYQVTRRISYPRRIAGSCSKLIDCYFFVKYSSYCFNLLVKNIFGHRITHTFFCILLWTLHELYSCISLVLNRCSSTLFMNGFKFGWYQKIKCLEQLIKLVHISVHVSWFFYMIDLYILDQSIFHKYESVINSTNVDLNFV